MRFWLLTNTTFGTWLPGDRRGSVTSVRDRREGDPLTSARIEHDVPGEPWEESLPGLVRSAQLLMTGPPIYFQLRYAEIVLAQFQETAAHRDWVLHAAAIMANHFHLVVQVPGDPRPKKILADFKAYGSLALNREFGQPESETWWTTRGSKRKLDGARAVESAIAYVLYRQRFPLVVWSREQGRLV
jgi:REP element-mobilizing transposase RayT